jgi:hypothetical protein
VDKGSKKGSGVIFEAQRSRIKKPPFATLHVATGPANYDIQIGSGKQNLERIFGSRPAKAAPGYTI